MYVGVAYNTLKCLCMLDMFFCWTLSLVVYVIEAKENIRSWQVRGFWVLGRCVPLVRSWSSTSCWFNRIALSIAFYEYLMVLVLVVCLLFVIQKKNADDLFFSSVVKYKTTHLHSLPVFCFRFFIRLIGEPGNLQKALLSFALDGIWYAPDVDLGEMWKYFPSLLKLKKLIIMKGSFHADSKS